MHYVTGAPGAGKSSVVPALTRLLPSFVVLDMDLLLEPASALAGVDLRAPSAAARWPAYNELWRQLLRALARTRQLVVLGPLTPAELPDDELGIAWALLDCADGTRRRRLRDRGAADDAIRDAIADAAELRTLGLTTISTDGGGPGDVAERIARWVETAPS